MKKYFIVLTILVLVAFLIGGCTQTPFLAPSSSPAPASSPSPAPTPPPGHTPKPTTLPAPAPSPTPILPSLPTPAAGADNFRMLISDEANAIDDFEHLYVTISSIGVHQGGEAGVWHTLEPKPDPDGDNITGLDLKPLVGQNALVIWDGTLPEGEYTKVFIYVDEVKGILTGGTEIEIKLPSQKLQISKPFTIGADSVIDFVYDITVVEAGKSGKYILKPQIGQSGSDQKFNEVKLKGKPEESEETEEAEEPEESEGELKLRLHGKPGLGAEVVLFVTDDGSPVEGASVMMNGEEVGTTDADGQLAISLPDASGEIKIEVTLGEKSGEIELKLKEQEEAEAEWFEGIIIALHEGQENSSPWVMNLEGVEGEVTVYVTELEGTPSVGAHAEVEGILVDNVIENAKAKIEEED
jgi:hypothetical protein